VTLFLRGYFEKAKYYMAEACDLLTDFYIDTRYPVHWPSEFSRITAEQAREAAEKIQKFVKDRLR